MRLALIVRAKRMHESNSYSMLCNIVSLTHFTFETTTYVNN